MTKQFAVLGSVVAAAVLATTPVVAQQRSAVSPAELEAGVVARSTSDKEVVQQWLQSGQVTDVARGMGVNTTELSEKVATLDPATLRDLAGRARADQRELAGGSTIVISTTVIIIALLVIILIVVA